MNRLLFVMREWRWTEGWRNWRTRRRQGLPNEPYTNVLIVHSAQLNTTLNRQLTSYEAVSLTFFKISPFEVAKEFILGCVQSHETYRNSKRWKQPSACKWYSALRVNGWFCWYTVWCYAEVKYWLPYLEDTLRSCYAYVLWYLMLVNN
jgi:hypothetical protein